MIECKTAQLFDASCRLGAHAAGCDEAAIAGYGDVGRAYGMAFQIRDDVAGIWSTVDETGKTVGSDIARRKWTFPVVWAIAQPPSAARDAVADAYAQRRSARRARRSERVVEALDALGAREAATQAAAEHLAVIERHRNRELRDFLRARSASPPLVEGAEQRERQRPACAGEARLARLGAARAAPVAGLVVRLLFIDNEGFKTDVATYEAWAIALAQHGFATFYSTIGFADYPPGYFYILARRRATSGSCSSRARPRLRRALRRSSSCRRSSPISASARSLYAIVRRFAGAGIALGAAALYLLNPATIYISASWGQVDSIAGGLALLAIYALLRSEDPSNRRSGSAGNARSAGSSSRGSPSPIRC